MSTITPFFDNALDLQYIKVMRETNLKEFQEDGGKLMDIANLMRVTPGAITKMLKQDRDIRIIVDTNGVPTRAYEIRKFPR
jgi:predicted transcriptional regulator